MGMASSFRRLDQSSFFSYVDPLEMRWYTTINMELVGIVKLDQPRGAIPCFPEGGAFDERPEHSLGEGASLSVDVLIGHVDLFRAVLDVDEIPSRRSTFSAIGKDSRAKGRLVANQASGFVAIVKCDCYLLSGIIVLLELLEQYIHQVVQSRNNLELHFAQDWAFQCFRKRLLDFSTSMKL